MNFNIRQFNMGMIKDRCAIDSHKSPMIVIIGKKDAVAGGCALCAILELIFDCL